ENVTVEIDIGTEDAKLTLFEVVQDEKIDITEDEEHDFRIEGTNATWVVPQLSEKEYTIELEGPKREQGPAEVGNHVKWKLSYNDMEIEYLTPAPEKEEKEAADEQGWRKYVTVRTNMSNIHYSNVLVSVDVPPQNETSDEVRILSEKSSFSAGEKPEFEFGIPGGFRLIWINGTEEIFGGATDVTKDPAHGFRAENGTVFWTVPQLSEQNYILEEGSSQENISAYFLDSDKNTIQAEINLSESGVYSISFPEERRIKPGFYTLVLEYQNQTQELNFTWGLISINTLEPGCGNSCSIGKSIFHPGETARIAMVVLDEKGHLSSGRSVFLNMTDPSGKTFEFSTEDGSINETSKGVYAAEFSTIGEGTYKMFAKTYLSGKEVNITSSFLAKESYEFDILRDTQVTLDPRFSNFTTMFYINSYVETDEFTLIEKVPSEFKITAYGEAEIISLSNETLIIWRNITQDSEQGYSAEIPWNWPYLYRIGEAEISYSSGNGTNTFMEAREWLLAIDPLNDIGMIAYGVSTDLIPRYRFYNGTDNSAWSSAANASYVGAAINYVILKASPTRYEEFIMGTMNTLADIGIQAYNGTGWSSVTNVTQTATNANYR
ncbi:MAG: hypothetical protein MUP55_04570, partial [Candidatus Aenigmarchaeota archaeon]|nr:hypothetical protein [Candidatus Aenigmarchaeota archaeon]